MILRFYMDIPAGTIMGADYFASTRPPTKPTGFKRVAFDVELPDEVLMDVDHFFPLSLKTTKLEEEKEKTLDEKLSDTPILEVPDSF